MKGMKSILPSPFGEGSGVRLFLLLPLFLYSCGSDDTPTPDTPETALPEYLHEGTDTQPTWMAPEASLFEASMSVQVEPAGRLADYQSPDDLMRAVINGETRAVARPVTQYGVTHYTLIIFANPGESAITLQYYCSHLHRIYTLTDWATFDSSAPPTGDSGIYRPQFTE